MNMENRYKVSEETQHTKHFTEYPTYNSRLNYRTKRRCGFVPFPDPPAEEPPVSATTFN